MNRASGLPSGTLRWAWATLTSMRTALLLLVLLGLAAIPGSLLPQRPTDPLQVAQYLRNNPEAGVWLDRLGFFDVFGSPWFAAVYLLLFVSLIGCIIPRCQAYYQALRSEPGALPRRFSRFPHHRGGTVTAPAEEVLDAALKVLRSARYRVRREPTGLSAERGYLREAGNLVFHLSLVVMLVGLAWGSVFSYRGTAIVVEGQAFSNTLTQYDEFSSGAGFDASQLIPFTIGLDSFYVRFETAASQRGTAREFRADVTVTGIDGISRQQALQVNHPLSIDGTSVHLLGHGYAPVVTVRDGNGDIAWSGPVVFLPQDANFTSEGVIKAPDARPQRLAFEGVFLPTAVVNSSDGIVSAFPDLWNPQLLLNAWYGEPKVETGLPENVYSLDTAGLTQLLREDGDPVRSGLEIGATFTLPDDRGSVTFDGVRRWTKLQISTTPGSWLVLTSVLSAILGICFSLLVRPRRLFVRAVETDSGTQVEVAGLDRVEGRPGLDRAVESLALACGLPATMTDDPAEEQM